MRRALSRDNRDFHITLQCGLPGLVSPQHSSFVIVSELPAFLLRRLPSFLGQVVTLTSHANRFEAARHQGRRHWVFHPCVSLPIQKDVSILSCIHSHKESSCKYSFIRILLYSLLPSYNRILLYSLLPSYKVASHIQKSKSKSKIQKSKSKKKR